MSKVTQEINESNFKAFLYDLKKIFVWDNRFQEATFRNNTGAAATFAPGTVVARDPADNAIVPFDAAQTDGRNIPIGVLKTEINPEIADAATKEFVNFCHKGDVAQEQLVFVNGETLDTLVTLDSAQRTVADLLRDIGVKPVEGTDNTIPDNT